VDGAAETARAAGVKAGAAARAARNATKA
jgi:hypothetical protein